MHKLSMHSLSICLLIYALEYGVRYVLYGTYKYLKYLYKGKNNHVPSGIMSVIKQSNLATSTFFLLPEAFQTVFALHIS